MKLMGLHQEVQEENGEHLHPSLCLLFNASTPPATPPSADAKKWRQMIPA